MYKLHLFQLLQGMQVMAVLSTDVPEMGSGTGGAEVSGGSCVLPARRRANYGVTNASGLADSF